MCGRSVIFSLCNLDTGMTNTLNLSPSTSGDSRSLSRSLLVRCTCCGSQRFKSRYMPNHPIKVILTNIKPTNLKSVLSISGRCCLMCVFRLLTWLILHLPLRVCGCMLWTFCYPATLVQDKGKNIEVRGSSRLMLSNKGFMRHYCV